MQCYDNGWCLTVLFDVEYIVKDLYKPNANFMQSVDLWENVYD